MFKSKLGFLLALLLSSQCFAADVFLEGKSYLYYTVSDPYTVYYGKVQSVTPSNADMRIVFDKLEVITSFQDCGGGIFGGACKINHYLETDKSNRSAMLETLLTRPISFPRSQIV